MDANETVADSQYQLKSVESALHVLDCFSPGTPELRLIDISRTLEISKVQALRMARTLEVHGFLSRDPRTKYYRLGLRLFQLGMLVQQQSELQRIAHPFLQELAAQSSETSRLVVPDRRGPTCIDLVESPRRYKVFGTMGGPSPWHAGTSTKLLLAFQPEAKQEEILAGPLLQYTPHTTTDPGELRKQLALIREQKYHVSAGDIEEHATAIAATICDRTGEVVAAISVSGPTSRIEKTGEETVLRWVTAAADDISRSLGYVRRGPDHLSASIKHQ
jgi:DNA-binding IclR family transcriptional regulator